jgi:hypothetical protein
LSSKAFESWSIIPQLKDVDVDLIGPLYAAESTSGIRVAFTAVTAAENFFMQINQPTGFDFSAATVDDAVPSQEIFVQKGNVIRLHTAISPGQRVTVTLRNVILGKEGGQTNINLNTSVGGMFQNGEWVTGDKCDEMLALTTGFRLPGRVILRLEKMENNYKKYPERYPVQFPWDVQMDRPAFVEFHFELTQHAHVGHQLRVYAPPYSPTLLTSNALAVDLVEALTGDLAGSLSSSLSLASRTIDNEILYMSGGELRTRLDKEMLPFTVYELRMSVVCPSANCANAGDIYWTIETVDGEQYPANTNDGDSRNFEIVEVLGFQVLSMFTPPTAEVEVSIVIQPGIDPIYELHIVAPLTFNFSANCLVYGGAEVLDCQPGKVVADGRATAILTCREDGFTVMPEDVRIRVHTPRLQPTEKAWFVQAVNPLDEVQTAWGEAEGIEVEQMLDTAVVYPGVPAVTARMVWRFRSQVVVQAGGYLQIDLPPGMEPECSGDNFESLALPSSGGCDIQLNGERVLVFINSTIVPAEYAFAIQVTPPVSTPFFNKVSLTIRDQHNNVRDAAVDLEGYPIYEKLRLQEVPMYWNGVVKPGRTTIVTIGFEVLFPLPDLVVAPEQQIEEILITLPTGFTHEVNSLTDFTLVNEDMPLEDSTFGAYLNYMEKDRLRVILNLNKTSWTTLKVDRYQFRFPVTVPSPLPIFNVWHLSLCHRQFPGGCSKRSDPSVLITYAIPGFSYGQLAPGVDGHLAGGATRGVVPRRLAMLLLLLWPLLPTSLA